MVQIWESEQAMVAALGENWREPPKLSDEMRPIIDSMSVEHYELADAYRSDRYASLPTM